MSKRVVIIIPTHKTELNSDEEISLAHLKKYLNKYDTFFVIPKRAKSRNFTSLGYKVKTVSNRFFGTIQKYSELVLTKKFYEIFKNYDFMLIYHLDCLVFSNQMEKWLDSGFDYIGAPWFNSMVGKFSNKKGNPYSGSNSGFSLKNIKKAIRVLDIVNKSPARRSKSGLTRKLWFLQAILTGKSHRIWFNAPADNYPFNEDGFWFLEAPKYDPSFKVPPFKTALEFSFEKKPEKCFKLNGNKLPFGAHGWKKYGEKFWEPYLLPGRR